MKRISTLLLLLFLMVSAEVSAANEYNVFEPSKSSMTFVFKQMNVPVEGVFKVFSADIFFDSSKPQNGRAKLEIDLNSIDVGNSDGNIEVKKKNCFDTQNFPRATFVSSSVKPLQGDKYEVSGRMSIKGVVRDVKTQFAMKQIGAGAVFEGVLPIRRLEYKIGEGIWSDTEVVADEVLIKFKIYATENKKEKNNKKEKKK